MRPRLMLSLLVGLTCLMLGAAVLYADNLPASAQPDLTIFYTNDVWGYLEPCG